MWLKWAQSCAPILGHCCHTAATFLKCQTMDTGCPRLCISLSSAFQLGCPFEGCLCLSPFQSWSCDGAGVTREIKHKLSASPGLFSLAGAGGECRPPPPQAMLTASSRFVLWKSPEVLGLRPALQC